MPDGVYYSVGESTPWTKLKFPVIRNTFPISNSAKLIFSLPIPLTAPVFANGDNTANLRADSWRVLEKSERQDKLPGNAPYEKLPQVIQISPSILARESQRKVCDMASASLKERISETCHAE